MNKNLKGNLIQQNNHSNHSNRSNHSNHINNNTNNIDKIENAEKVQNVIDKIIVNRFSIDKITDIITPSLSSLSPLTSKTKKSTTKSTTTPSTLTPLAKSTSTSTPLTKSTTTTAPLTTAPLTTTPSTKSTPLTKREKTAIFILDFLKSNQNVYQFIKNPKTNPAPDLISFVYGVIGLILIIIGLYLVV